MISVGLLRQTAYTSIGYIHMSRIMLPSVTKPAFFSSLIKVPRKYRHTHEYSEENSNKAIRDPIVGLSGVILPNAGIPKTLIRRIIPAVNSPAEVSTEMMGLFRNRAPVTKASVPVARMNMAASWGLMKSRTIHEQIKVARPVFMDKKAASATGNVESGLSIRPATGRNTGEA